MSCGHAITKCTICRTVQEQCRCIMKDKPIRYVVCSRCSVSLRQHSEHHDYCVVVQGCELTTCNCGLAGRLAIQAADKADTVVQKLEQRVEVLEAVIRSTIYDIAITVSEVNGAATTLDFLDRTIERLRKAVPAAPDKVFAFDGRKVGS